jgi:hypothetical protein
MAHTLLIVEDGDEYLRFFSRYIHPYEYLQARTLHGCLGAFEQAQAPAGIILDLRFDRVARVDLTGDAGEIADTMFGGEMEAAWRYIVDNQGFLLLREIRDAGYDQPALIISDLPERRRRNVARLYGNVAVVKSFDREAIVSALEGLLG